MNEKRTKIGKKESNRMEIEKEKKSVTLKAFILYRARGNDTIGKGLDELE